MAAFNQDRSWGILGANLGRFWCVLAVLAVLAVLGLLALQAWAEPCEHAWAEDGTYLGCWPVSNGSWVAIGGSTNDPVWSQFLNSEMSQHFDILQDASGSNWYAMPVTVSPPAPTGEVCEVGLRGDSNFVSIANWGQGATNVTFIQGAAAALPVRQDALDQTNAARIATEANWALAKGIAGPYWTAATNWHTSFGKSANSWYGSAWSNNPMLLTTHTGFPSQVESGAHDVGFWKVMLPTADPDNDIPVNFWPGGQSNLAATWAYLRGLIGWVITVVLLIANLKVFEEWWRATLIAPQGHGSQTTILGTSFGVAGAAIGAGLVITILFTLPAVIAQVWNPWTTGGAAEAAPFVRAGHTGIVGHALDYIFFLVPLDTAIAAITSHLALRLNAGLVFSKAIILIRAAVGV